MSQEMDRLNSTADRDIQDLSDLDLSESWADARADTPTVGEGLSDTEDTLSNLSFDNELEADGNAVQPKGCNFKAQNPPVPAPRHSLMNTQKQSTSSNHQLSANTIELVVTPSGEDQHFFYQGAMARDDAHSKPSGLDYKPPSVDFPKSPSQLKALQGPSFLPKEEPTNAVSEDDSSFAALDLNVKNGGVRLTKKKDDDVRENPPVTFDLHEPRSILGDNPPQPDSLGGDALDDYIEDFILPHSHETIMSRQKSFRRRLQKQLETVASENALKEIDRLDSILATYSEEDENDLSSSEESPISKPTLKNSVKEKMSVVRFNPEFGEGQFPVPKPRSINKINAEDEVLDSETGSGPTSLSIVDIDTIVKENAPNLMAPSLPPSSLMEPSILNGTEESISNYFLPQPTLDKLCAVYESSNFNNLYCLSGELKNLLTPAEIEEIVANKEQLENLIDPNVMAALSWSLTEVSLPPPCSNFEEQENIKNSGKNLQSVSKSSSLSNGFHSDGDSESVTSSDDLRSAGAEDDASSISCGSTGSQKTVPMPIVDEAGRSSPTKKVVPVKESSTNFSIESVSSNEINDLGSMISAVNKDVIWEDEGTKHDDSLCLVRRDSTRCSKKKKSPGTGKESQAVEEERVIEGLFVESKNPNPNGTLKRLKVPLNIAQEEDDPNSQDPELPSEIARTPKRKISVDDNILSIVSGDLDDSSAATDISKDVFHSIINTLKDDEDSEILAKGDGAHDDDEDTFNIDTPDDMQDSIMEQLATNTKLPDDLLDSRIVDGDNLHGDSSEFFRSIKVGPNDINIDLKAIQPYRRVLSHGGYFDAEKKIGIILFSACYLPDRSKQEYTYLMDHLFLYVLSSLEELIEDDYILVYLHGSAPKSCMPTFGWLKRCYQLVDHRLKKNMKKLYLVHPTFWLRTVVTLTRPFVSSKFTRKLEFVNTLSDLCLLIPTEHLVIPDRVLQYDFDQKVYDLKKRNMMS